MRIGVFDSGIGGLTVLIELQKRFPNETFIYFGDTANVPYGTKSVSQIRSLCKTAAHQMIPHHLDLLVVACNTASSLAIEEMTDILSPIPVVGVVEAGVSSVLSHLGQSSSALILGTRATIQSHIYRNLLKEKRPEITVHEQACPLLVPMIEEGWRDHPILIATIREYVAPYLNSPPSVALLACTHYPWIKNAVGSVLKDWSIIDSATSVAQMVTERIHTSDAAETLLIPTLYFSDPDSVSSDVIQAVGARGVEQWLPAR